jgi:hypothetical protein
VLGYEVTYGVGPCGVFLREKTRIVGGGHCGGFEEFCCCDVAAVIHGVGIQGASGKVIEGGEASSIGYSGLCHTRRC